jgi:pimeloyl-ACP methyl ester carboxylesterase
MASVPGGELYYQLRGAGRPIVLLHAGFMDHRMWDEQFELLAGDFTTIRYDARGHGRSSAPVGDFSNFQDLHDLLAGLGVPRATLVGLSLGARTAVDFALTHPHMVEGLALAAPGVSGMRQTDPVLLEYAKAMAAAEKAGDAGMLVEWFLRSWVDGPGRTPAQVDQAMRARCQAMAAGTVAKLTRDRGRVLEVGAIGRLDELRAPTLVMVGDLDSSDIHQVADLLAAQVPGAAKVAVGGAGHMLNLERRDVFDRALLAFLDSAGTA